MPPKFLASYANLFPWVAILPCEKVEGSGQWGIQSRDLHADHSLTVTFTRIPIGKMEFRPLPQSVVLKIWVKSNSIFFPMRLRHGMEDWPESELVGSGGGGFSNGACVKLLLQKSLGVELENVQSGLPGGFSWAIKFENYCFFGNALGSWVLVKRFI